MSDYRDEFQRLLESTYIPSNGNKSKIVKEFNAFLDNTFQHTPEKLYMYAMLVASQINTIHVYILTEKR